MTVKLRLAVAALLLFLVVMVEFISRSLLVSVPYSYLTATRTSDALVQSLDRQLVYDICVELR
ncbi:hypothetical protein UQ15_27270, partial [Escherichia coli]